MVTTALWHRGKSINLIIEATILQTVNGTHRDISMAAIIVSLLINRPTHKASKASEAWRIYTSDDVLDSFAMTGCKKRSDLKKSLKKRMTRNMPTSPCKDDIGNVVIYHTL